MLPVCLKVRDESGRTFSRTVTRLSMVLGRARSCVLRLTDPHASRHHLKLWWDEEDLMAENLSERNPARCNGMRFERRRVHSGDVFQMGLTEVTVIVLRPPLPTATLVQYGPDATMPAGAIIPPPAMKEGPATDTPRINLGPQSPWKTPPKPESCPPRPSDLALPRVQPTMDAPPSIQPNEADPLEGTVAAQQLPTPVTSMPMSPGLEPDLEGHVQGDPDARQNSQALAVKSKEQHPPGISPARRHLILGISSGLALVTAGILLFPMLSGTTDPWFKSAQPNPIARSEISIPLTRPLDPAMMGMDEDVLLQRGRQALNLAEIFVSEKNIKAESLFRAIEQLQVAETHLDHARTPTKELERVRVARQDAERELAERFADEKLALQQARIAGNRRASAEAITRMLQLIPDSLDPRHQSAKAELRKLNEAIARRQVYTREEGPR